MVEIEDAQDEIPRGAFERFIHQFIKNKATEVVLESKRHKS